MTRKKSIDRERILDAAERVLMKRGVHAMTLDVVAAEAGISKGGLTYSFATKEALLAALLDRGLSQIRPRLKLLREPDRGLPHPELRGFLNACLDSSALTEKRVRAVVAAVLHAPGSLKTTRSYLKRMLSKFSPRSEQGRRARMVFYATQGLVLLQGCGLVTLPAAERKLIVEDFVSFLTPRTM